MLASALNWLTFLNAEAQDFPLAKQNDTIQAQTENIYRKCGIRQIRDE